MRKQKVTAAKTASKKTPKTSSARISKFTPTQEDITKAMAAMSKDAEVISSLKLEDEEVDKYQPIVFSDTWYEASVLAKKLHLHPKTLNRWMDKGWLAYSPLGKIRLINKFDFEDMLLHFRKPAIWAIVWLMPFFGNFAEMMAF